MKKITRIMSLMLALMLVLAAAPLSVWAYTSNDATPTAYLTETTEAADFTGMSTPGVTGTASGNFFRIGTDGTPANTVTATMSNNELTVNSPASNGYRFVADARSFNGATRKNGVLSYEMEFYAEANYEIKSGVTRGNSVGLLLTSAVRLNGTKPGETNDYTDMSTDTKDTNWRWVKIDYDFIAKKVIMTVEKDGASVTASRDMTTEEFNCSDAQTPFVLNMQSAATSTARTCHFRAVKVSYTESAPAVTSMTGDVYTFERGSLASYMSGRPTDDAVAVSVVDDTTNTNHGKVAKLKYTTSAGALNIPFDTTHSSTVETWKASGGLLTYEFDARVEGYNDTTSTKPTFRINSYGGYSVVTLFNDRVRSNNVDHMLAEKGDWAHIKVSLDLANLKMRIFVNGQKLTEFTYNEWVEDSTDDSNSVHYHENSGFNASNPGSSTADENALYVDNFDAYFEYAVPDSGALTYVANSTDYTAASEAVLMTGVKIPFNTPIDATTLTEADITLKKGTTPVDVTSVTLDSTGTVATVAANFDAGADYTLSLGRDVKAANGNYKLLATDYTFRTWTGALSAETPVVDSVATLTEFGSASALTLKANVTNTHNDAKAVNIIIALYKDDVLTNCVWNTKEASAKATGYVTAALDEAATTALKAKNYDEVRVFVWADGFVPLSTKPCIIAD